MQNTNIKISNVKENKKYKGAYARIFKILNKDSIFVERFETDKSKGFENGTYFLEIEGSIDANEHEEISKIKNVEILSQTHKNKTSMKDIISFYSKAQIKNGGFSDLIEELSNEGFDRKQSINEVLEYLK